MKRALATLFGSGLVVNGYYLNNELTDFNLDPNDATGRATANRVEAGKRPRSSMSPTIVLQGGQPLLAVGSPGGSTIITTVLGILVNRLDRGLSISDTERSRRRL